MTSTTGSKLILGVRLALTLGVLWMLAAGLVPSAGAVEQAAPDPVADAQPSVPSSAATVPAGLSARDWAIIQERIRQDQQEITPEAAAAGAAPATELKKLLASDGDFNHKFGYSVDVSGDTVVVGAIDGEWYGAAYIFERNHGGPDHWGQVKKLAPDDPAWHESLGKSVAIDGDTVVVGDSTFDVGPAGSVYQAGAACIFQRNHGGPDNWGQVQRLTASDAQSEDWFGWYVDVSADTVVVGAHANDIGGRVNQGAVYIFQRDHGGTDNWGQLKRLTADDGAARDYFGWGLGIDGDIVVAGARGDDDLGSSSGSAYIFHRDEGGASNWGQVKKLTASDGADFDSFGTSAAVDGDTIVIGADWDDGQRGSAYVFSRDQGGVDNWGEVKKLTASDGAASDHFGDVVAIHGDTVLVGSRQDDDDGSGSGSAYVFERNEGGADTWGQVQKLTASDAAAGDYFGNAVALAGGTMVVGAYYDEVGGNVRQGSAYLFVRQAVCAWDELSKASASDGMAGDRFGDSTDIDGNTLVVGAPYDNVGARVHQGSAYVFHRSEGGADNWGEVKHLIASDGAPRDSFGQSVAVDGHTAVVGAWGHHWAQGAAYVFYRDQDGPGNWGEVKKLVASDAGDADRFGVSVAIDGDTIVIGAHHDAAPEVARGSAYVFYRNRGGTDNWGQVKKLKASDGAVDDVFGQAVAVDGHTIVVGAPMDDCPEADRGSAYVFYRNRGGADNWGQVRKIKAGDGAAEEFFGYSVGVSGDVAIVGAHWADAPAENQGAAYLFQRDQGGADNWGQVKKLTASDGEAIDLFGWSVGIAGSTAAVGAYNDAVGGTGGQGSVYLFERDRGGAGQWGLLQKLTASDGAPYDFLGYSVAIDGARAAAGAPSHDGWRGAAYVYGWFHSLPGTPADPAPADGATDVGINSDLKWAPTEAMTCTVYFGTSSPPPVHGTTLDNGYALPTLAFSTTYYWKVVAENDCGSTEGPEWDFTTGSLLPPPALESPGDGEHVCDTQPWFRWGAVPGATSYHLQGDNDPAFASIDISQHTVLTYYRPDSPVLPDTYYWRVRATLPSVGQWSSEWTVVIEDTVPGTPGSPSPADDALDVSVDADLDWADATDAVSYTVYFGASSPPPYYETTTSSELALPKLDGSMQYFWQVEANNSCGSTPGPEWDFTTCHLPGTPALTTPADDGHTCDQTPEFVWAVDIWATSWRIQVDQNQSFTAPDIDAETGSSNYTPGSPLDEGTWYWRVRASNDCGDSDWSEVRRLWIGAPSDSPVLLLPEDDSHTCDPTPYFEWQGVLLASTFRVQVDNDSDFSSPEVEMTTGNLYCEAGLPLAAGTYHWRVRAENACGDGPWSEVRRLWIGAPLGSPVLLLPGNDSHTCDTTPYFEWQGVLLASTFRIQVDDDSGFASPEIETTTSSLYHDAASPLAAGTYHWRVRAENACGDGPWSSANSLTIDPVPGTPSSPSPADGATDVALGSDLDWADAADAISYTVYFGTSPSPPYYATTTVSELALPKLAANTQYLWKVEAHNECGMTAGPPWDFTTCALPATAPVLVSPGDGEHTCDATPALDWDAVGGATAYHIQVDDDPAWGSKEVNLLVGASHFTPGTPLAADTYYWRVRAKNDCGYGPWSVVWSFTIDPAPGEPSAPLPADGATGVALNADLDWADCTDAISYTVYFGTSAPLPYYGTTTSSELAIPQLAPSLQYHWQVQAHNECGTTAGPEWDFTTGANHAPALGAVDPAAGSGPVGVTTYFTTTWTDADGWEDLKQCYFHIGDSPALAGNVTLLYNALKDKLWLLDDSGSFWTGGCAPATMSTMENSQAVVHCDLTTAGGSGDTVTVVWAIEFKPGYSGEKKTGLKCKDIHKAKAKGKWKGTWTVAE